MKSPRWAVVGLLSCIPFAAPTVRAPLASAATPISPVGLTVPQRTPTFQWTLDPGETVTELRVYARRPTGRPIYRELANGPSCPAVEQQLTGTCPPVHFSANSTEHTLGTDPVFSEDLSRPAIPPGGLERWESPDDFPYLWTVLTRRADGSTAESTPAKFIVGPLALTGLSVTHHLYQHGRSHLLTYRAALGARVVGTISLHGTVIQRTTSWMVQGALHDIEYAPSCAQRGRHAWSVEATDLYGARIVRSGSFISGCPPRRPRHHHRTLVDSSLLWTEADASVRLSASGPWERAHCIGIDQTGPKDTTPRFTSFNCVAWEYGWTETRLILVTTSPSTFSLTPGTGVFL